jgi:hypothetical protein
MLHLICQTIYRICRLGKYAAYTLNYAEYAIKYVQKYAEYAIKYVK